MKPIVFRGESYHRTKAEREPDELSLGGAVQDFFNTLDLDKAELQHLKQTYREAIQIAIQNERKAGDNSTLTTEQKIDVINRSLFVASRKANLMERIREIKSDVLIPELLQKKEAARALQEELAWVQEAPKEGTKRTVVVVQIDLDNFKVVNDEFGHESGDTVLKEFGEGLHSVVRISDQAIHFSGDEFGILMRFEVDETHEDVHVESAIKSVLSRIIENSALYIKRPDEETQALSVGYTTVDATTVDDERDLFEEADRAVSISKISGLEYEINNPRSSLASQDRVFSFKDIETYRSKISAKERFVLDGMRCLKRAMGVLAREGNLEPVDVTQTVYNSLRQTVADLTHSQQTHQ